MATAVDPERFDRWMERRLYGPDGFYHRGDTGQGGIAGRRGGDFLTSPEVGPLFGAVLARWLTAVWDRARRPSPFTVYDVGCGPGTLLRTVRVAVDEGAVGPGEPPPWELVGVDRVDAPGASTDRLPDDLTASVVVANELLDNLPFRILERTADGLAEVWIEPGPAGERERERLVPVEAGPDLDLPDGFRVADLAPGTRFPLHEQASRWVTDVLDRGPLALLCLDYGTPTTAELASRGGWLRTYRDHERGDDPLDAPGTRDVTTDVAWDRLPAPDRLESQADFLTRWGIEELVDEGRRYWQEHAARPDLRAMRMRSRIGEAEALRDPAGLGGWWAATWRDHPGSTDISDLR